MNIDGTGYVINIEKYDKFNSYEDLFNFLLNNIGESFIFYSIYGRPIQRKIQSDLKAKLSDLYKKSDYFNNDYYIDIFECRGNNCSDFPYLNEGQEVIGLFERGVYNKPLNFV